MPPAAPPPPPGGYAYPQQHPRATIALVLGIIALIACQFLGPVAWAIGHNAVKEIDASGGVLGGRSEALAGKILGIIATIILAVGFVILILVLIILIILASNGDLDTDTTSVLAAIQG